MYILLSRKTFDSFRRMDWCKQCADMVYRLKHLSDLLFNWPIRSMRSQWTKVILRGDLSRKACHINGPMFTTFVILINSMRHMTNFAVNRNFWQNPLMQKNRTVVILAAFEQLQSNPWKLSVSSDIDIINFDFWSANLSLTEKAIYLWGNFP